jgi:nucleoid-associated protein YgaU
VTPSEPEQAAEPTPAPAENPAAPPRPRRRWPWLALLVLILAAALGVALGVGVVLRGRSLGPELPSQAGARPTFVVGSGPSPSPSGSPRPTAGPSVAATGTDAYDEYVVAAGDTLRSIAGQVYGDPAEWPRIYDANRDIIGADPDALNAGTHLRIPRP